VQLQWLQRFQIIAWRGRGSRSEIQLVPSPQKEEYTHTRVFEYCTEYSTRVLDYSASVPVLKAHTRMEHVLRHFTAKPTNQKAAERFSYLKGFDWYIYLHTWVQCIVNFYCLENVSEENATLGCYYTPNTDIQYPAPIGNLLVYTSSMDSLQVHYNNSLPLMISWTPWKHTMLLAIWRVFQQSR